MPVRDPFRPFDGSRSGHPKRPPLHGRLQSTRQHRAPKVEGLMLALFSHLHLLRGMESTLCARVTGGASCPAFDIIFYSYA